MVKSVSFEDIFKDFKNHYPELADHIIDYRPGPLLYTIYLWFDCENPITKSREIVYFYKTKEYISV